MKTELKTKLAAEFEAANFFDKIPNEIENFTLKKILDDVDDKFIYFTFENRDAHKSLTAYFHEETQEYKVRVKIGLTEFCLTNFFTDDFNHFIKILESELAAAIKNLNTPLDVDADILIADQNFSEWNYSKSLPKNLEGFELFASPENPIKITNGSYIIINYSDFENERELSIIYNVYTNNFSGESQIGGVNHPLYIFDAKDLKQLEKILEINLSSSLRKIRQEVNR